MSGSSGSWQLPVGLTACGVVIHGGALALFSGGAAVGPGMATYGVSVAALWVVGIVAFFIVDYLLELGDDGLGVVALKLLAISALAHGIADVMPYFPVVVFVGLVWGLTAWLFDLESFEGKVFAVVMLGVAFLVNLGVGMLFG